MTGAEMLVYVQDKVDHAFNTLNVDTIILESAKVYEYLNRAQYDLVTELATNKQYHLIRDLLTSVETETTTSWGNVNYAYEVTLETVIDVVSLIVFVGTTSYIGERISPNEAGAYYTTAYHTPFIRDPKYFIIGDSAKTGIIILDKDKYDTLSGITPTIDYIYIDEPTTISYTVSSNISTELHTAICDKAYENLMKELTILMGNKNQQ